MASHTEQNDHNMVETLTTILKKVRFFGYGSSELNCPLDSPPLDHLFDAAGPGSSSSSTASSPTSIAHQDISYVDSDYSSSLSSASLSSASLSSYSGYTNNSIPLAESYSSCQYQEDLYDKEFHVDLDEDEVVPELDLDQSSRRTRRRRPTGAVEEDFPPLPEFSLNEVAQHDMFHDCWMILYDKVYDVTQFLYDHPGGEDLIMEHAGRDGTMAFRGVGHSKAAIASLRQFLIGQLPEHERIFTSWLLQ